MQFLNALNENLLASVVSLLFPNREIQQPNRTQSILFFLYDAVFDPTAVISTEQTSASTSGADSRKQLDSSVFLPSVFEEKESSDSDVADVIAQQVNDACSKSKGSYKPTHSCSWP